MSHKHDSILKERPVLVRGIPNGTVAPPGEDYCWECGHIAPLEDFLESDKCPNPECPYPGNWDD